MARILLWITIFTGLRLVNSRDFTYKGSMGPEHWAEEYSTCSGKLQSPINIVSFNVTQRFFEKLKLEEFKVRPLNGTILNNGHTAILNLTYEGRIPFVKGGPFKSNTYEFLHMHFHWGSNNKEGSEDRIDNFTFPAEMHIVLKNIKYSDFNEATQHNDGLAVLASFFNITEDDNPHYEEFSKLLEQVQKPQSSVNFPNPPHLTALMPVTPSSYFTYIGSLTTPPCSEDVIWLDFNLPISISERQINRLRHLSGSDGKPLEGNFRPVQPLNNRKIYFHAYDHRNYFGGIPLIKSSSSSLKTSVIHIIFVIIAIIFIKY